MASVSVYLPKLDPKAVPLGWTIDRCICWLLVVAIVFLNGADFRGDTGEEFALHWQIYLRLLNAAVCGVVGLLLLPKTYRDFLAWPGVLLTALCVWYLVTVTVSVERTYSLAAWGSLVGVGLFVPGAMRILGPGRILGAVAAGLAMYLIGSWIAYLAFPEVGVFREQVTENSVYDRMGGLGHPNELGFYSAYAVLLFSGLALTRQIGWPIAAVGIALGGVTLFSCFSRTAIIACACGLLVTYQQQLKRPQNLIALIALSGVAMLGLFIALGIGKIDWLVSDVLVQLTKSGNTRELTTATGRTEIWSFAMEKIREAPLLGYGYSSTRFVMEDYSLHGHNMVLNAMLFGGVTAGFLMLAMLTTNLLAAIKMPCIEVDGIVLCIIVGGLVDGILPAPSPEASTFLWILLLFWRQLGMQVDNHVEEQPTILTLANPPM